MNSRIVFVAFPGFFLTALTPRESSWLGCRAVIRDGRILEVTPEAEKWGVLPGITRRLARQRCSELVVLDFNSERCHELFENVWSSLTKATPLVEPVAFHEGFLDLTGCTSRGKPLDSLLKDALWKVFFDTSIRGNWGGGRDKWIAKLARGENRFIDPEDEDAFLCGVACSKLGLSSEICSRLLNYGIRTVAQLLQTPRAFFQAHLQLPIKDLLPFLERDSSPVEARFPPPHHEIESSVESEDDEVIHDVLRSLAEAAAEKLERSQQQCGSIRITLRTREDEFHRTIKLLKPMGSTGSILNILRSLVTELHAAGLRSLLLSLENLIPAPQEQLRLWTDRTRDSARAGLLEIAGKSLERKQGFPMILSGSEYARKIPPRFAQLIYAKRGISLP